jgi:hypothetical protein
VSVEHPHSIVILGSSDVDEGQLEAFASHIDALAEEIVKRFDVIITGMSPGYPHAVLMAVIEAEERLGKQITKVGYSPDMLGQREDNSKDTNPNYFDKVVWMANDNGANIYIENAKRLTEVGSVFLVLGGAGTTRLELEMVIDANKPVAVDSLIPGSGVDYLNQLGINLPKKLVFSNDPIELLDGLLQFAVAEDYDEDAYPYQVTL